MTESNVYFMDKSKMPERFKLRKPVPPCASEVVGIDFVSVIELNDGSLLSNNGRRSVDGGITWSEEKPSGENVKGDQLLRLKSGKLALGGNGSLWVSDDEGNAWSEERKAALVGTPLNSALTQLESGRLVWPSRDCFGNLWHVNAGYEKESAYGMWRGQRVQIEGHGHIPEISIAGVSHSDDEGQTWVSGKPDQEWGWNESTKAHYSSAILMGWFGQDGHITTGGGWVTDCDEPTCAETSDGRVLFFGRSTVGRIVQSYSSDGGETWTPVLPSNLASSYGPSRLVRIPETGDLLCVWNQVSGEEIRRGYRRGRLTAAISKDGGETWVNFRTLELSDGLDDADRVYPEFPIPMLVRARKDAGPLPDAWAYFSYANVSFAKGKVYVQYYRGCPLLGIAEQNFHAQENVLRIYPLDYFYE